MDFRDAIQSHPLGIIIRFDVSTVASRLIVPSGFNPWRKALEARLTQEPTGGKANRQLISAVAKIFSIPEGDVEIMSGQKSARKVLLIKGLDLDRALSLLAPKYRNISK
ncbi:MAG: DUF167 family protein [Methanotrichaceae archaeon]